MSLKTITAMKMGLNQALPVYTNIVDNTGDQSFLPKSFLKIPDDDWTLIQESAFIIYDSCEYIPEFTARFKNDSPRLKDLLLHRHFGKNHLNHNIVFIFQHEKFANLLIRQLANEHINLNTDMLAYNSARLFLENRD
ncbi:P-loop NTPase family protein [Acinetobacter sp. ANC 4641]|uniref:zonular occludens toxin domain-containing protein n=1 Tax=Acinetobacter sp. ANC 4641 TaxID=2529847 RepID=UPI0013F144F3|nr:zonular occludens toxin domain-containing protein [Acinetobacter sp. ANC 4641]